ncbi:GNAT family N-acetyltransferase [Methylobacterium organophilum]|uniref:GNAT family N-acetyltransferase n=1 Tax=Methylobacterium organophilum TaxID=410 RepID=UPI001F136E31|nr:GNAT family N-acetyltransferase [Methylobacterium organophilum]UMY17243.1 GNAT family N-acetyltransferase [Methylobacterium organophilum]
MGLLASLRLGPRRDRLDRLPAIETDRLRIAPLLPEDAAALQALTDDPAITAAVDFLPDRFRIEDARGLIGSGQRGRDVFLGVRGREDPALLGVVGTHLRASAAVEIGYWMGGAARGRGYAAEAVGAVVRTLARAYPRRLLVAECRPQNEASSGLLRKLGFEDTGEDGHRPGRRVFVWRGP